MDFRAATKRDRTLLSEGESYLVSGESFAFVGKYGF